MDKITKHYGSNRTYQQEELTLGLFFPLEAYKKSVPIMDLEDQIKLAKRAEEGDFAALFVRDVPLNDPCFGDVGQMYDPWIFLSHIAAHTKKIALGTASAITSFTHPLALAKSAASFDKISNDRLLFGLATGDRPIEFDAFDINREDRAEIFRESVSVMRDVWANTCPTIETKHVRLNGVTDLLPKPNQGDIPIHVTGFSGQSLEWIAEHGDGWVSYPRNPAQQKELIADYRALTNTFKPFSQSLYIDLSDNPNEEPTLQHLGFRSGHKYLIDYLYTLEQIGVNHVMFNIKNAKRPAADIIQELAEEVVPHFPSLA